MKHSVNNLIYSEETLGYYNTTHIVCFEPYALVEFKEDFRKEDDEPTLKPLAQLDKEREQVTEYYVAVLLSSGKPVFINASTELQMYEMLENYVSKFE